MKKHYSMLAATRPSRSSECRRVQSILLNNHYVEAHSRCGGLRADGPISDVLVYKANPDWSSSNLSIPKGPIKRIESPQR